MNENRLDANRVINKLVEKIGQLQLEVTLLELRLEDAVAPEVHEPEVME